MFHPPHLSEESERTLEPRYDLSSSTKQQTLHGLEVHAARLSILKETFQTSTVHPLHTQRVHIIAVLKRRTFAVFASITLWYQFVLSMAQASITAADRKVQVNDRRRRALARQLRAEAADRSLAPVAARPSSPDSYRSSPPDMNCHLFVRRRRGTGRIAFKTGIGNGQRGRKRQPCGFCRFCTALRGTSNILPFVTDKGPFEADITQTCGLRTWRKRSLCSYLSIRSSLERKRGIFAA